MKNKNKKIKRKLIASFKNTSPKARALNTKIEEVFNAVRVSFAGRKKLENVGEKLKPHIVKWHGVKLLTLAHWRSDISPKLQLVWIQGKFFFGYTACGGLAPLDGEAMNRPQIKFVIQRFFKNPVNFLEELAA